MSFIAAYEPGRERGPAPASELRPATRADATALALLEPDVRPGDVDARITNLRAAVDDPEQLVVMASVDSEPVGYGRVAHLTRDVDDAPPGYYLAGVTVARRWRRRGPSFQGITFTGGIAVLLCARRPAEVGDRRAPRGQ